MKRVLSGSDEILPLTRDETIGTLTWTETEAMVNGLDALEESEGLCVDFRALKAAVLNRQNELRELREQAKEEPADNTASTAWGSFASPAVEAVIWSRLVHIESIDLSVYDTKRYSHTGTLRAMS